MLEGWIKLHRKIGEWEWHDNPVVLSLFIHLLIMASQKDSEWHGEKIGKGSVVTTIALLAKTTGLSVQNIRTAIKLLKSTNNLTNKTTNKYTVISINNFSNYQQLTRTLTNNQQTTNKQTTIPLKEIKIKERKEITDYIEAFNSRFSSSYQETTKRTVLLRERLKKFTMEQIIKAIDNMSRDKFCRGENESGWIADPDYLIRNDEIVDRWLNRTPKSPIMKRLDTMQL